MTRRAWSWVRMIAAVVWLASGCKDKAATPSAERNAGSDTGSGSGSGSAAPCNDDDIRKHIDDTLAVMRAYVDALEKRTASWKLDCEAAGADLRALEPAVEALANAMTRFNAWGEQLTAACVQRAAELGEGHPGMKELENHGPGLDARIKPVLEHCNDHPGFQEAVAKGLRAYKKKW
jgi:hypothetical protein